MRLTSRAEQLRSTTLAGPRSGLVEPYRHDASFWEDLALVAGSLSGAAPRSADVALTHAAEALPA